MEDLSSDRDENECLEALTRLKSFLRVRGEHKQKVQLNLSLSGIQVIDEATKVAIRIFVCPFHRSLILDQVELASHEIRRIRFVLTDPRDPRAFGYIYKTTDERHQFWAIKTERFAQTVVFTLKDIVDEVYQINKNPDEIRTQQDPVTSIPASRDETTVGLQVKRNGM